MADLDETSVLIDRQLDQLSKTVPDGLWVLDLSSRTFRCNDSLPRQLGYEPAEFATRARELRQIAFPEDYRQSEDLLKAAIASGRNECEARIRFRHREGHTVHILSRMRIRRDESGQPIDVLGLHTDVTSLINNDEHVQHAIDLIQMAMHDANDGLWDLNLQTMECRMSARMLEMLGYSTDEVEHTLTTVMALMHPEDVVAANEVFRPVLDGIADDFTNYPRFIHKDGSVKHFLCRGKTVRDLNGTVRRIVGWHTDITERMEYERRLQTLVEENNRARQAAEAANRAKSAFLATISHELRTPLNAIVGFSELLQTGAVPTDQAGEYMDLINSAGLKLLSLINDVLDYSKIEAGVTTMNPADLLIAEEIRQGAALQLGAASLAGLTVEIDPGPEDLRLWADSRAVRQIVNNLLSNAVKFTAPGGHIQLWVEELPEEISLYVSDTGIGIDPDLLPLLGQPFRQGDESYTRRYQGTGLGLSLVRALADLHKGRLNITSMPGVGTTVSVHFPKVPPQLAAA